jgi:hypothetical protein
MAAQRSADNGLNLLLYKVNATMQTGLVSLSAWINGKGIAQKSR